MSTSSSICRARLVVEDEDGFDWNLWCNEPKGHTTPHQTSAHEFDDCGYLA